MKRNRLQHLVAAAMIFVMLFAVCLPAMASSGAEKTSYTVFTTFFADPNYPLDGGEGKPIILAKAATDGIENFDFIPQGQVADGYYDRLNIMAASNQLPDVFMIDTVTAANFAKQKLLLDLTDLAAEYIPNLAKYGRQSEIDAYKVDGRLYALPSVYLDGDINSPNVSSFIIRQDWLDELGLASPDTLEDLENALRAFKAKNPDTIPYVAHKTDSFAGIFGAFGVITNFWMERDGKLQHGSTLPEVKEALALLNKWYNEGLIDHDYLTNDTQLASQKFFSGQSGLYNSSIWDTDPRGTNYKALLESDPKTNIVSIVAPAGPDGLRGYPESAPGQRVIAFSSKIKNPELICKYINWIIDPSENGGHLLITYGVEGTDYTYDAVNDRINQITANPELVKKGFQNQLRWIQLTDRRWMLPESGANIPVASKYVHVNAFWAKTQGIIDHPELFNMDVFNEYMAKIITGSLPVDAFDEYVKKFNNAGGAEVTEEVNAVWLANQMAK